MSEGVNKIMETLESAMDVRNMGDLIISTCQVICNMLSCAHIPYELRTEDMEKHAEIHHLNGKFGLHMILHIDFPWSENKGDVAIGTLHMSDDELMHAKDGQNGCGGRWPSIETYKMPWDDGDITVFDNPDDFMDKIQKYYDEVKEKENKENERD